MYWYLMMLGMLIMLAGLLAFMAGQRDMMGLDEDKGKKYMIILLILGAILAAIGFFLQE